MLQTLLGVGGLLLGSGGTRAKARAAKKAAFIEGTSNVLKSTISQENARIARENAVIAKKRSELQVGDIQKAGRELISTQKAVIGASGIKRTGSAANVIQEGKRMTAQDVMITRMLGEQEAQGFLQESRQLDTEGLMFLLAGGQATGQAREASRLARYEQGATLLTGGAELLKGGAVEDFKKLGQGIKGLFGRK